jgi:RHS repeat-associated protein
VRHYHLDHLGSPRLVTDSAGVKLFGHTFLPYGEEVTDPTQSESPFRFTGHERDFQFGTSLDDQDYMHARFYSPHLGRFGRVDPVPGVASDTAEPESVRLRRVESIELRGPEGT